MPSSSPKPIEPMFPSSKPNHGPHHPNHGSIHCPRCDSTHTKFCYYNNYSLSQPRYFCKSCRRYWTKGGTLRNIPVGGLCRKNKKISSTSKKVAVPTSGATSTAHHHRQPPPQPPVDFPVHPQDFMFENLSTNGGGCGDFPAVVAGDGEYGVDTGYNYAHGLDIEMVSYDHDYYESMMMNGIDVKQGRTQK